MHLLELKVHLDPQRLFKKHRPNLVIVRETLQAFSVAHANILAATYLKLTPTPSVLWRYVVSLEAEFNDRALEEHEYNKQKSRAHGAEKGKDAKAMGKDNKGAPTTYPIP
eukprot:130359-Amphidinium_carterae.1